jgi:hypothetical protein
LLLTTNKLNPKGSSKIVSANDAEGAMLLLIGNVIQCALRTLKSLLPRLNNYIAMRAGAAHWATPLASVNVCQLGGVPSLVA